MNTPSKYVTVKEVADLLSVSTKTVYQWSELGKMPCYKINGCLRFDLNEVLAKINACKSKPQSGIWSHDSEVR